MRRKATLAITLAAAMAATAVPAMADDKVSITIFNSKMEIQSQEHGQARRGRHRRGYQPRERQGRWRRDA